MVQKLYFVIGRTEDDEFDVLDTQTNRKKLKSKDKYKKDSFDRFEFVYFCEEILPEKSS